MNKEQILANLLEALNDWESEFFKKEFKEGFCKYFNDNSSILEELEKDFLGSPEHLEKWGEGEHEGEYMYYWYNDYYLYNLHTERSNHLKRTIARLQTELNQTA